MQELSTVSSPVAFPHKAPSLDLTFDFTTSEEVAPLPVHEVELQRARRRRHDNVPNDVYLQEFVGMSNIVREDTLDPVWQTSCLDFTDSLREYYGDSEDAAYRAFRENMVPFLKCNEWLKRNRFAEESVYEDYKLLRQFEDDALRSCDSDDEDTIVEAEVEAQSEAHQASLQKHRHDYCSQQLGRRLLERRQSSVGTSLTAGAVIEKEDAPADVPLQRQWKGKSYRESFMGVRDGR
ncbi:hypothetical protein TraAM80_04921 [Trypanosoma rangeli]|uniref:Uncharacterized protein n=1 Tax=Trypanosoma rangeli TaxID=5698 RepID=A0A3R7NMC2_TRYRA|nr:uncharacterized protein TraAM80_04921 [Trypanosoma rangeli]RNF04795.1 hypothetical protein TraAM80_04921 [Trypanosoma rangeli]|eukprot:RNF04795.1 hypothetical protein TraAM80_04921 [Trypanosoma rangeli]